MSSVNIRRRGFTLLELLFVVAIIGVLGTTAIAMFRMQQQRAKRTEAMTNLDAIAKLQTAYYGENGSHPASIPVPAGAPGLKQNWDAAAAAAFGSIGFSTDGSVFYVYDTNTSASVCACPSNGCFTAAAYGDSDRDGNVAVVAFFHADEAGSVCDVQVFPGVGPPIDPVDGLPIVEQPVDIFQFSGPIVDDY
jgi:prepilin-type N-terminal cleavage/methylation domain-containing protein